VDDLLAWIILALTLVYIEGETPLYGIYGIALMLGFFLFEGIIVRKVLSLWYKRIEAKDRLYDPEFIMALFFGLLWSSWIAEVIGIHAFLGAFLFGLVCPKDAALVEYIRPKIEILVINVFVPVYFAYSGLRTDLTSLHTPLLIVAMVALVILASLAKFVPACLLSHYAFGQDWNSSACLGILINTRGLVSLIAANIGLSAGIFEQATFSMLVCVNSVTTMMASPLFYYLYERQSNPYLPSLQKTERKGKKKKKKSDKDALDLGEAGHSDDIKVTHTPLDDTGEISMTITNFSSTTNGIVEEPSKVENTLENGGPAMFTLNKPNEW